MILYLIYAMLFLLCIGSKSTRQKVFWCAIAGGVYYVHQLIGGPI